MARRQHGKATPTTKSRRLHWRIARRLFVAWLVLSAVLTPLAYSLEQWRLNDYLFGLARGSAARLNDLAVKSLESSDEASRRTIGEDALRQSRFIGIEIYSRDRERILEVWLKGHDEVVNEVKGHVHEFPALGTYHHNKIWRNGELFIQTLVPLSAGDNGIAGYFEGVYHVDPITAAMWKTRIQDTLVLVIVVVSLTSLVLYPVIVALNRQASQLTEDLLRANLDLMRALGSAIAKRDSDTGLHNYRVTLYAIRLARAARVGARGIRDLIAGAFLHDVGKIAISDAILLKPGKLTETEFETIKTHVRHGIDIVAESAWLAGASEVVASHHEKVDGSGYPKGLRGESIPINARMFAIADVFDALTSERPYKRPVGLDEALKTMREGRGSHFDPVLLDRFLPIAPELHRRIADADEPSLRASLRSLVGRYW